MIMIESLGYMLGAIVASIIFAVTTIVTLPYLYRSNFIANLINMGFSLIRTLISPIYMMLRRIFLAIPAAGQIVSKVSDWLDTKINADKLESDFNRRYSRDKDALTRGDLLAAAEERYPSARFPWLYRSLASIPEDIQRPVIIDGRLPGGLSTYENITAKYADKITVAKAKKYAIIGATFWALMFFVFLFGLTTLMQLSALDKVPLDSGVARQQIHSLPAYGDIWSPDEAKELAADLKSRAETAAAAGNSVEATQRRFAVITSGHGITTSIALFFLIFFASWRATVRAACQDAAEPFSRVNKEETVRFKHRIDDREVSENSHKLELATLDYDDTPLLRLGQASGVYEARGSLSAPKRNATMQMSLMDMGKHVFISGATGGGKSRSILLPMISQLLELRGEAKLEGHPERFSFYGTDAKGVLWQDIYQLVLKAPGNQVEDVRVIGIQPHEYGIDLLNGVHPRVMADILCSCIKQVYASGQGGDFWERSATDVIRNLALICSAWEQTEDGLQYANEQNERPYSLTTIFKLAQSSWSMKKDDEALIWRAMKEVNADILRRYDDPSDAGFIGLEVEEIEDAIGFFLNSWNNLAEDTRSSIGAHINIALGGFSNNMALRRSFGNGGFDKRQNGKMISISEAWGSIFLLNIPMAETGSAGRLTNIFLKTLFYMEARKRQVDYVNQYGPDAVALEKLQRIFFVADEFQELVSADPSGESDSSFWNVARSTGTSGIVAVQSHNGLIKQIGEAETNNLLNQFRTSIMLLLEDNTSVEMAVKRSGTTLRSYTYDNDHHESYAMMVMENKEDILMRGAYRYSDESAAVCNSLLDILYVWFPIQFIKKSLFDIDYRFVKGASFNINDPTAGISHYNESLKAATWRAEDRLSRYMSEGNNEVPLLKQSDITSLGSSYAVMYVQRAGGIRMDIVKIQ